MIFIPFIIKGLAAIPRAMPIIISRDMPNTRVGDASAPLNSIIRMTVGNY
jgi:hypothetical protein